MYAIIEVAGKQYKVEKGMKLFVDKLNVEAGQSLSIDKVLFISDEQINIGKPYCEGVVVKAVVQEPEVKDKKVIVFHYKNKTGFHKTQGHRQRYTQLTIEDITSSVAKKAKKATKETVDTPAEAEVVV